MHDAAHPSLGVYTALITPFRLDGDSDAEVLHWHVDWQTAEQIHGLIPHGSTGRFLSLTLKERRRGAEIVVKQAADRVPVLLNTGAESTPKAIAWTSYDEDTGTDDAMISTPFYSLPDDKVTVAQCSAIAGAVRFPIMIYNNPLAKAWICCGH